MADTPEAAATATEATPTTNINSTDGGTVTASDQTPSQPSQTDSSSAIDDAQVAKYFGTDTETLDKFRKFVEANGQFDTVFEKVKSKISNPEPRQVEPQIVQVPTNNPQQVPTNNPLQVPTNNPQQFTDPNVVDMNTIELRRYFRDLSEDPKYASIKDDIKNGVALKEMYELGMTPLVNGGVREDKVYKFLDMKAKGAPAPQTSSEPEASPAPTVGYIPVGENIESKSQALQILQQNVQLKAMGQAEHPATAKAKEYLKGNWGK